MRNPHDNSVGAGELKKGFITTDDQGQKISKKTVKVDTLPRMQVDDINQRVLRPSHKQMTLRSKFATGICKLLRRYMTNGKEEETANDLSKMAMIKQKTRTAVPASLLSLRTYKEPMEGAENSL